jgi:hypothetical protein
MHIVKYADAYSYACGIAPHKYKQTAYAAMQPHFKIMDKINEICVQLYSKEIQSN